MVDEVNPFLVGTTTAERHYYSEVLIYRQRERSPPIKVDGLASGHACGSLLALLPEWWLEIGVYLMA
jgi:hypothetical protein